MRTVPLVALLIAVAAVTNGCAVLRSLRVIPPDTSRIQPGEQVDYFDGAGKRLGPEKCAGVSDGDGCWELEVRGGIHRERSFSLLPLVRWFAPHRFMKTDVSPDETKMFDQRARLFFFEWERGRQIPISFDGQDRRFLEECAPEAGRASSISNGLGLFRGCVRVPAAQLRALEKVEFKALAEAGAEPASGVVHLIMDEGISVISDIDDTIKHSNVPNREELLLNTFYREFEAVPLPTVSEVGQATRPTMATVYRAWAEKGNEKEKWNARFHYVSGSPWQLHKPLAAFLTAKGFPQGTLHLRPLRFKDPTIFFRFAFRSPKSHKLETIRAIIERFPRRCYVLVGDSGESDPEVYKQIAQEYPTRIDYIYIRTLSNDRRTYPLVDGVTPFTIEPGVTSAADRLAKLPPPTCTRRD